MRNDPTVSRHSSAGHLSLVFLCLLLLPFFIIRLASWPQIWFDEGVNLQAAKNIALHGEYALRSADEFRRFDSMMNSTGPTVLIPVAVAFELFGVGLAQGRLISLLYALMAAGFGFMLASKMLGGRAAIVTTLLMIWSPWSEFPQMARYVMGEMATLAFVLASLYCWWRSFETTSLRWTLGTGAFLGLALLSKQQAALVLVALVLTGLVDLVYYKQIGWRRWLIPFAVSLLVLGVWEGVQVAALGPNQVLSNLQTHALGTSLRPARILANFNNLASTGYLLWAAPALIFAALSIGKRKRNGGREFFVLITLCIWLAWYLFGSVGWIRYAFVPIAITSIFLVRLYGDILAWLRIGKRSFPRSSAFEDKEVAFAQFALALIAPLLITYGIVLNIDRLVHEGGDDAQRMATLIDAQVEPGALVETWEWELSFLSDRSFHLPPFAVLEQAIREIQFGLDFDRAQYDPWKNHPAYLVDGPFSKWTRLYSQSDLTDRCIQASRIGAYDLYSCK